jgi:hypothetical protein
MDFLLIRLFSLKGGAQYVSPAPGTYTIPQGGTGSAIRTEYVRFRLRRAGCDREVFTSDALLLLHEVPGGVHRDIDRIAALVLRFAAMTKQKLVSREHMAVAAKTGA